MFSANCDTTALTSPWDNPKLTVGEALDLRIRVQREALEKACIAKAKLETLQMLDYPYHEISNLLHGH